MKVFGIAGRSGMGKTSLLERLIPRLVGAGLRVSLLKHSHKDIEVDRPGKDSHRLRDAGCQEVLLLGSRRWALMHELRDEAEPTLAELLPRIQGCDLLLVEGFKSGDFPKLEVWRPAVGKPMLWPDWPGIVAVASDVPAPAPAALPAALPAAPAWLDLADTAALAALVLAKASAATHHNRHQGAASEP